MASRLTLSEIRRRYVEKQRPLPHDLETSLRADTRPGAQAILAAIERRRRANRAEGQRLRHMLRYEQEYWSAGVELVAGVDEAGMSPLAGPVVAGAVILPKGWKLPEVDDSKKLDAETRNRLAEGIKKDAIAWAVGIVSHEEIDRINIYRAGLLAMVRAVQGLTRRPEALLIDARKLKELDLPQKNIIGGDGKSLSIAAASILAKTHRDGIMDELDKVYPAYGFCRHKGYGVPEHHAALQAHGVLPIHRRSFGPVRKILGLDPIQQELPSLE